MESQEVNSDKVNVHTSKSGDDTSSLLIDKGWFTENIDVFRSAIAYALAHSLQPKMDPSTGGRSWNVGSVDKDGVVTALLALHGFKDRPMATSEGLAEIALEEIGKRVRQGESLSQIFLN